MTRATEPIRGRFSADPQEMRESANRVRKTTHDFSSGSVLKYQLGAGEVGNETLSAELAEFQRTSSATFDLLLADSTELVNRVVDAARDYEDLDNGLADRLSAMLRDQ
ncbi:hypothetical protein [Saccharopolyspora endophytica]|uniref:Uncharacterized protein n=1 Tax=Saccharopolyspora endophytica TaxID=543886 RepID=A0ABS5DNT6_9PSEU|nr:hypothetical protein [Saccharopolyspora endophytica]MBQ0927969.1 hypothetical protein [Saccharopolyspora endophytica]